jgi:hypothetical protein
MKKLLIGAAAAALVSTGAFAQVDIHGKGSAAGGAGINGSTLGTNARGAGSLGTSSSAGAGSSGATTGAGVNAGVGANTGTSMGGASVSTHTQGSVRGGLGAKAK